MHPAPLKDSVALYTHRIHGSYIACFSIHRGKKERKESSIDGMEMKIKSLRFEVLSTTRKSMANQSFTNIKHTEIWRYIKILRNNEMAYIMDSF